MPDPLPLSPAELGRLADLEENATDAPWTVDRGEGYTDEYPRDITVRGPSDSAPGSTFQLFKMSGGGLRSILPDAALAAAARNALPRLLAELRDSRAAVAQARAQAIEDAGGDS